MVREEINRTMNQHRFYWAAVMPELALAKGYKPTKAVCEALHEEMKLRFLPKCDSNGEIIGSESTTTLSTLEFKRYVDEIEQHIAALRVSVSTGNIYASAAAKEAGGHHV